jgi:hypothetical protein
MQSQTESAREKHAVPNPADVSRLLYGPTLFDRADGLDPLLLAREHDCDYLLTENPWLLESADSTSQTTSLPRDHGPVSNRTGRRTDGRLVCVAESGRHDAVAVRRPGRHGGRHVLIPRRNDAQDPAPSVASVILPGPRTVLSNHAVDPIPRAVGHTILLHGYQEQVVGLLSSTRLRPIEVVVQHGREHVPIVGGYAAHSSRGTLARCN